MTKANSDYQEVTGGLRLHSIADVNYYTAQWRQAIANVTGAQNTVNIAQSQLQRTPGPPFPDQIEHDWQEPR